jgi:hypothetical protein
MILYQADIALTLLGSRKEPGRLDEAFHYPVLE